MLSLTPLFLIAAVAVHVFGTLRLLMAMEEAPIGYEKADGFHYGIDVDDVG